MEACKIRGTTQRLVSRTGAGRQGNIFSFQSREKNVLDVSSYRTGDYTSERFFFAFLGAMSVIAIYDSNAACPEQ
jgi:hypothetical protein